MKPPVVLLTGASGFLGSAILSRLASAGHRVIGLDVKPPTAAGARHEIDDLSDSTRLRGLLEADKVTHIIHAGGVSGPMVLADQPERVIAINVAGTLNLLSAALASGVATFVYCSSVSAVGDFHEPEPIPEDHPLRPTTTYGCSKAAVEMVLRGLHRRVPLDLCSLRFTGIYGPGRQTQFVIGDIVADAVAGLTARVGPATDAPYVFVEDAADGAIAACFSTGRQQLAYYISYPQQVTLEQLAAAAGEAGAPVRLDIDTSRPRSARGAVDIGPAIRDFGFAPKVDHREGIRRMVAALRARSQ